MCGKNALFDLKGISGTNLKVFRKFYLTYPGIGQALPDLFKYFPISQTLPDKFQNIDIEQIQTSGKTKIPLKS